MIIRTFVFILGFFMISLAQAQEKKKNGAAKISFEEPMKDYGDIKYGDVISHVFKFTNTGTEPLVIQNVVTTCSCTSRKYTEGPIAPGASGEITVTFDSGKQDKEGRQNKVITVLSNAINNPERVLLICNILK